MLIPFSELVSKYNLKPTGVIHIGGSHAEELEAYTQNGIQNMIWIEAIPEVFEKMKAKLEPSPSALPINACIADVDGKEVDFYVTNNEGQSSSMLGLNLHREVHPDVHVIRTIKCKTRTVDSLVKERGFDFTYYDFLNIDLQGAELLALKGMHDNMHKINYAYLEVNEKELYTRCALLPEIDAFMKAHGFIRVELKWAGDTGWGDAFYLRKTNLYESTNQ
jgi:FkbM family methyltransferase